MLKKLIIACSLLCSTVAFAEKYPVDLQIQHTPTYEDGNPFPISDLLHYKVCVSVDGENCQRVVELQPDNTRINDAISSGETLYFKVKAVDKFGVASDWSNTISKTIVVPSAPVLENVKIIIVVE